jgi:lipopolysaccharide transport system ATP-binding protein
MGHIVARGVGKAYKRYASRFGRLLEWLDPDERQFHEKRWVLRDVSFEVRPGESVGIIGHNGAGKSTLLKIITGTTRPTIGSVETGGRVAALLELGMGFHPEFTGRQNAWMSAQLLGLGTSEIEACMPAIIEFAEIGDYVDQPIRTYSSGMQVRLAFAVATAVRPEILIVDEALSVGDAYFQAKCIDRIRMFREQGTTLLFVSHSPAAIKSLCGRALLFDHGLLVRDGPPDEVLDYYNAVVSRQHAQVELANQATAVVRTTRSGTREATIESVALYDATDGGPVHAIRSGDSAILRVTIATHSAIDDLTVGVLLRDALGNDVFGTNSFHHGIAFPPLTAGARAIAEFRFSWLGLGRGRYTASVALHTGENHVAHSFDWWDNALVVQILPGPGPLSIGVVEFPLEVSCKAI